MSSWGGSSLHGPKFEMNLPLPKALAVLLLALSRVAAKAVGETTNLN
jgi:hypothetical protein